MQESLTSVSNLKSKKRVLTHLKGFLALSESEDDAQAKSDLQTILTNLISEAQKEINFISMNEQRKNKSQNQISFNHKTFVDWFEDHITRVNLRQEGSREWTHSFVQMCDYISSPGVRAKN